MKDVRDKVAGLDGWVWYPGEEHWEWADDGTAHPSHPIPDTLDACAAAWDRHAGSEEAGKWWVERARDDGGCGWWAAVHINKLRRRKTLCKIATGIDAASELRDRWALLGEVLKARGV